MCVKLEVVYYSHFATVLLWCSSRLQRDPVWWFCGFLSWSVDCGAEWLPALMVTGAVYAKKNQMFESKKTEECGMNVRCLPLQPPNVCFILETYLFDISKILPNDSKYS